MGNPIDENAAGCSAQSTLPLITEIIKENKNKINYIGSLSFEDRDTAGIQCLLADEQISFLLKREKIAISVFYLIDQSTYDEKVKQHRKFVKNFLEKRGIASYYFICCDFHDPRSVLDELVKRDAEIICRYSYLDISTLTRSLGSYLMRVFQFTKGKLVYFEPMKYGNILSNGLEEIDFYPELYERSDPNKEDVLIIPSGHEIERPRLVIEDLDPAKIVFIVPRGDDTPEHANWNREAQKKINELIAQLPLKRDSIEIRYTPSHIYQTNLCDLEKALDDHPAADYNRSVAPMGPKIINFALTTLTSLKKDICVYDAIPEYYNTNDYSRGVRIKNAYSFPLRLEERINYPY